MKLFIDNWRWQGVPFYVRTGKRLAKRMSEVVLTFREAPVHLFDAATGGPTANQLILRIQPDEGAEFRFEVKSPGSGMRSRPIDMEFSYDESFGEPSDEAMCGSWLTPCSATPPCSPAVMRWKRHGGSTPRCWNLSLIHI